VLYLPAPQLMHADAAEEPVFVLYLPVLQAVHAATLDAVLYRPTAHAVHVVAPTAGPVLVMEPAAHTVHAATLDAVLYRPAGHAVHLVAPTASPVLVMEPAAHTVHAVTGHNSGSCSVPLSRRCALRAGILCALVVVLIHTACALWLSTETIVFASSSITVVRVRIMWLSLGSRGGEEGHEMLGLGAAGLMLLACGRYGGAQLAREGWMHGQAARGTRFT
jgi:hypothetical protein